MSKKGTKEEQDEDVLHVETAMDTNAFDKSDTERARIREVERQKEMQHANDEVLAKSRKSGGKVVVLFDGGIDTAYDVLRKVKNGESIIVGATKDSKAKTEELKKVLGDKKIEIKDVNRNSDEGVKIVQALTQIAVDEGASRISIGYSNDRINGDAQIRDGIGVQYPQAVIDASPRDEKTGEIKGERIDLDFPNQSHENKTFKNNKANLGAGNSTLLD
jgi:hypothetical protein